ncbi:putative LRR receptor-like serine/threonine-protein kinase [Cocos nucifera]|uniref:Receptor kinase-like protein Xa21 n=1 Tax=Cocos nucifera TaxID=13894 RepID=A0A8K0NC74_COCNU|nr:putative LRR receptor-like serine/threonine-protein kinase [Cocos nucifera]
MELHQILRSGFFLSVFLWAASSSYQIYTVKAILLGNETDRLALLAFKDQITRDNLGALSWWNDNTVHFCNWEGITCSKKQQQRVTALELRSWGLGGSLSPSIGNLTFLQKLILDNNNNKMPTELGRLRRLKYLNLSGNSFQGVFPVNLTHCSKLRTLSLFSNQLVGNIPVEIGSLSRLNVLYLGNNSFTGVLPSSIASLTNASGLQDIDIPQNNFSGKVPSDPGRLQQLYHLNMEENQLKARDVSDWKFMDSLTNCSNLQILSLHGNKLEGQLPNSLVNLSSRIQVLAMGTNQISGNIPHGIGNLANLNRLTLENNLLIGGIPESVGRLARLELFGLSGNKLTGRIPSSLEIMSLSSLSVYLDLSHNSLVGPLPLEIGALKNLGALDVSGNMLSGNIPSTLGNCGGLETIGVPESIFQPFGGRSAGRGGSSKMQLRLRSMETINFVEKKQRLRKNAGIAPPPEDQFPRVSYTELDRATDGFSSTNLIGKGGYGSVYKGVLGTCQTIVAVKVFNLQNRGAAKSFIAECEALRSIRHRNLVKILTSCSLVDFRGNDFKALVFEFIPNGNLEKWLHPELDGHDHSESLSLLQRLNIAVDVAVAMDYLHNGCQPPIVHCDLKPSNVLLDDELVAHVGDFGLARFISKAKESSSTGMSSSIRIRGSIGYIAPEYGAGGKASPFGDVYSYGILLLEMLTGKSPINNMFKDGLSLQKFVEMAFPNEVMEIVDPLMPLAEDRSRGHECLASMARIGLCCSNQSARERMNVSDVATKMHAIRNTYLGARVY